VAPTVMRDKYFDPEGWRQCTLRNQIGHGQRLWLLCGTCRKSRYLDTAEWAQKHGVDLDTPLKTLGNAIRCQRCGTRGGERGVSAYAEPYSNYTHQPRRPKKGGPLCPRCGSEDVHRWPLRLSDFPYGFERGFMPKLGMEICGCESCDNWWTQGRDTKLALDKETMLRCVETS
jgi:hypothetical protein